ncbi:hypothetical protein GUITHDRAFT_165043 [Guillardia theta CCMP2712]|uniref:Uncharacterized protein n=1 Tax=Guillardia theta (strain CCMP2712) TaxID=905079 RepID=L1ISC5_GUITC|nr:hypothetical protein GUITHDRAFT_165043 [Guillardia theta CCMP2712]EKX39143.1 hypothetical protein GUITHDRAFT_165043 [Guillardia theta CCMP2712]|mmetsp:Transcript_41400/g.130302  ORF Transcript_41400/g.130302 Transcript_41400/m.130302 type:complete len:750 (-) Transcript_41400:1871-4120(-)|eukprot:XP_005826123.1 hypothetical protein GUITHDRAFT_165043 [Guillardia theta CCMP2712]
MRCFPTTEWKHNPLSAREHGAHASVEEDWLLTEQLQGKRKTYASSYDASFIFEQLWKKRFYDHKGRKILPRSCPEVRIPDTVIFRGGFPVQWYFHSKVDGRLLRKRVESITAPSILEVFLDGGQEESSIVAQFIGMHKKNNKVINNIVYFDSKSLQKFLLGESYAIDGFLQRFVDVEQEMFDFPHHNVTIYSTWSQYACKAEHRVSKVRMDSGKHRMTEKLDISPTKVDVEPISSSTRLHKKIARLCHVIADHIRATSNDSTEVTNMTCYFKIGARKRLWLLWVSSIAVGAKFQDAFGYIQSLKTFTGRHSPELVCSEFVGAIDYRAIHESKPEAISSCALCNVTQEENNDCASYAISYQMLSKYVQRQREKWMEENQELSISSQVEEEWGHGDALLANVRVRAKTIFTCLNVLSSKSMEESQLWWGLFDLGFEQAEVEMLFQQVAELRRERGDRPPLGSHGDTGGEGRSSAALVSLDEFEHALSKLVFSLPKERGLVLTRSADKRLEIDGMDDTAQSVGSSEDGSKVGAHRKDASRAEARKQDQRALVRNLPNLAMRLRGRISFSDLRKILYSSSLDSDAGAKKIWVCRSCAMAFNKDAREMFEWSEAVHGERLRVQAKRKFKMLQQLDELTDARLPHSYPLRELPALCTPRMYEALHSHASRASRPAIPRGDTGRSLWRQRTSESSKTDQSRGLPAIGLSAQDVNRMKTSELEDIMNKLGLTPRRPQPLERKPTLKQSRSMKLFLDA